MKTGKGARENLSLEDLIMNFTIIAAAAIVLLIVGLGIYNAKRNGAINKNGIEANAVVTRVKESVSTDSDGISDVSYTYYVTYQTRDGQSVEAQLGSGKSVDVRIGRAWDDDLHEGVSVRIKYLPEKPKYVIRIS